MKILTIFELCKTTNNNYTSYTPVIANLIRNPPANKEILKQVQYDMGVMVSHIILTNENQTFYIHEQYDNNCKFL